MAFSATIEGMNNFQFPPAFGFESKKRNAGRIYQKLANGKFHRKFSVADLVFFANAAKVLGYFPFFGFFIGLFRAGIAFFQPVHVLPNKWFHFLRGIGEAAGWSFPYFLIADLIATKFFRPPLQRFSAKDEIIDV